MKTSIKRNVSAIAATMLFFAAIVVPAVQAVTCYAGGLSTCGTCPTSCVYTVVCGIYPPDIDLCNGTSPGIGYFDVYTAPSGTDDYDWWFDACKAPVTLTGTCCGGARTTTVDKTPILETFPAGGPCGGPSATT